MLCREELKAIMLIEASYILVLGVSHDRQGRDLARGGEGAEKRVK
jgi:hypothetical protein